MDYLQYVKKILNKAESYSDSFKPYYRWITFNTNTDKLIEENEGVLNLIIDGLPSIRKNYKSNFYRKWW